MSFAAMMLIGLGVDALLGWPRRVFAAIGHPVTWIGRLIDLLDRRLNHEGAAPETRRLRGVVTVGVVLLAAIAPAWALQALLPAGWLGLLLGGALAWPLIAARSLHEHVAAVAGPLARGDLPAARKAIAMIVGRDPERLDQAGVGRAAVESLAENASDGVVAPIFWGALLGLPGIAAYKAINTMDSMIGHRTPRHEAFGAAAARLDDWVNLAPARLCGGLFALGSGRPLDGLAVMMRDARRHRSPNAGWPESAMAAALDIRLSGPRVYHDRIAEEPWLNAAAADPTPESLWRGLALYRRAMFLLAALLGLLALI